MSSRHARRPNARHRSVIVSERLRIRVLPDWRPPTIAATSPHSTSNDKSLNTGTQLTPRERPRTPRPRPKQQTTVRARLFPEKLRRFAAEPKYLLERRRIARRIRQAARADEAEASLLGLCAPPASPAGKEPYIAMWMPSPPLLHSRFLWNRGDTRSRGCYREITLGRIDGFEIRQSNTAHWLAKTASTTYPARDAHQPDTPLSG
jgi:hypothetical protein